MTTNEAKQIYENLQAGMFDMSTDAHGITVPRMVLARFRELLGLGNAPWAWAKPPSRA